MSAIIQQRFRSRSHDLGGGFTVGRVLPGSPRRALGPFVFIDYFGPVELPADRPMDVRPHPHIGLSTLTYLWQGRIRHRDSLGSDVVIEPGAVNWMTAGSGIVHSERTPDADRGRPMPLHGLQLWLALPLDQEETAPAFSHTEAAELPHLQQNGADIRVVVGSAWGQQSPVPAPGDPLLVDCRLDAGAALPLPDDIEQRGVFLLEGDASINGEALQRGELAILTLGQSAQAHAATACHVVLFGGPPLDAPRYLMWNFVSSSAERIQQAAADWRAQRMPAVPGDAEFIPLAEQTPPPIVLPPE